MPYQQWFDVVRLILDMKQERRHVSIPIVDFDGRKIGRLEPLGVSSLGSPDLLRQFVRWRNQNLAGFLDQRPTTEVETARWLDDVVTNPTRIAFLIFAHDTPIGRCGSVQIRPGELMTDGLVRGEQGGGKKFMYYAQIANLIWTFHALRIETVHSKILSTNDLAIENYRNLGCDTQPCRSAPMYRISSPAGDVLEEFGSPTELLPDVLLNYYQLKREPFLKSVAQSPGFKALGEQIQSITTCTISASD